MQFIDEVTITVQAGNGGAGYSHFRREKFVPRGGPDGGDGGHGGSVILKASSSVRTLLDLQLRSLWAAESGNAGESSNRTGANGRDLVIELPLGTEVYLDALPPTTSERRAPRGAHPGDLLGELLHAGDTIVIARGGKGGKGNAFFKSATNRAPTHAQPGLKGESCSIRLSLKLLADIGLLGFPNAGKSTLLSAVSAARPKIANYPFTTLTPQLGVVALSDHRSFVLADIPGLIEGASQGKGLGIQFLKHLSRVRGICILLDPTQEIEATSELTANPSGVGPAETEEYTEGDSLAKLDEPTVHLVGSGQLGGNGQLVGRSIVHQLNTLLAELAGYSEELTQLPRIIAISKVDCLTEDQLAELIAELKSLAVAPAQISSVTGQGISSLMEELYRLGAGPVAEH